MTLTPAVYREETGKWIDDQRIFTDSAGNIIWPAVLVDEDGNIPADFPSAYGIYKTDDDASPNYFGFQKRDGAWVILRETLATGDNTYEFNKGPSDIVTAWSNRVGASYDTFANTF